MNALQLIFVKWQDAYLPPDFSVCGTEWKIVLHVCEKNAVSIDFSMQSLCVIAFCPDCHVYFLPRLYLKVITSLGFKQTLAHWRKDKLNF